MKQGDPFLKLTGTTGNVSNQNGGTSQTSNQTFKFDSIFQDNSTNIDVYNKMCKPIIQ